jgi:outer membrane protein assembly factor BamB
MHNLTRRAALMGAAGLLSACQATDDLANSIFGDSKPPIPGDRRSVLSTDRPLEVDAGPRVAVTLPPPVARADWPQVGGGLGHAPGNPALGSPLAEAWRASVGASSNYRRRMVAQPVSDGTSIFTVDAEGVVMATEAASGRRAWRFDTTPKEDSDGQLGGGCALADGVLYVVTGLAEAMALNPADGSVKWRVKLPAPARGAPSVAGGRVFVPTIQNQVVALKTADGEKLWTYAGSAVVAMALGLPAPAVEGDIVVCGLASGEIAAIRASDGRPVWTESLGSGSRGNSLADIAGVSGLPVIENGRVYVTAQSGSTVAIDLRSGRRLWERDVASAETPWPAGDWLFLLTASMELVCLGKNDGRVRWLRALPRWKDEARRRDAITWGGPVVAGGRVLITGNNSEMLELAAADGTPISRLKLPAPTLLSPIIFGGTMYLVTEDAQLVAIRGA